MLLTNHQIIDILLVIKRSKSRPQHTQYLTLISINYVKAINIQTSHNDQNQLCASDQTHKHV